MNKPGTQSPGLENHVVSLPGGRLFLKFIDVVEFGELLDEVQEFCNPLHTDHPVNCAVFITDADAHALLPDHLEVGGLGLYRLQNQAIAGADADSIHQGSEHHADYSPFSLVIELGITLTGSRETYLRKYLRKVLLRNRPDEQASTAECVEGAS